MGYGIREHLKFQRMSPERQARHLKAMSAVTTLCAGIWILGGGIWLAARGGSTACIGFLQWSLIPIGLAMMTAFVAAYHGVRNDHAGLQRLYLLVSSLAIVAFLVLMVFSFVAVGVSFKDDDKEPAVREYKLGDYKGWFRRRLAEPQYWATVGECLRDRHACKGIGHLVRDPKTGLLVPADSRATLSPIQSGCCKPPSSCAFTYVNGTMWTTTGAPATGVTNDDDADCSRWSGDQQTLCLQCDSCKAGVLEDILKAWSKIAVPYIFLVMVPLLCLCPSQVKIFMQ